MLRADTKNVIKGVGLLLVWRPLKPRQELRVLLRQRGLWNWETNASESWRNSFQVTCHGYVQGKETFKQALARELKEELGLSPAEIKKLVAKAREVVTAEKEAKIFKTFFAGIDGELISKSPAQDAIVPITLKQAKNIKLITEPLADGSMPVKSTIFPNSEIRMWPDEREAVWKVFAMLGGKETS